MTRPDYCPIGQVPCQAMCDVRCKIRDARKCHWVQTNDINTPDTWRGACGAVWTFTDGGPKDNGQSFCPQCGGVCVEVRGEKGGAA